MKAQRESNIELFRIISMLMILGVHIDGASLGLPELHGKLEAAGSRDVWRLVVEALTIIGVNCFTLISGFFGIRLRWRGVGIYLFQCVFYAVGIYTAALVFGPPTFTWKGWWESWLVLTHTDLWYVPAYFFLMLLSPFINAGFEALGRRRALVVTAVFTAYNIWAGWWWKGEFNPTGYTVSQLVMVYMIGRSLSQYQDVICGAMRRGALLWFGFAGYLVLSLATAYYACWDPARAYAYNSPMVIMASVSLFLCFRSMRLQSGVINYVARSAFAVYLIHKAPAIWGGVMKPGVITLWKSLSLFEFTIASMALMVAIYALAMVADAVRRFISRAIFSFSKSRIPLFNFK